jgi:hypothetical protein
MIEQLYENFLIKFIVMNSKERKQILKLNAKEPKQILNMNGKEAKQILKVQPKQSKLKEINKRK